MQDASHEQPRAQSQPQAKQLAAVCRETAEHALRIESKNFGEVPTA
jgi:hypothetical protein